MGDIFQKVAIIGFPGVGKTSVSKKLEELGFITVDLDDEIEKYKKLPISEIIRVEGIQYFRELEAEVLDSVVKDDFHCLSLGGGAIFTPAIRQILENNKVMILHIECEYDVIKERLIKDEMQSFDLYSRCCRPLIAGNLLAFDIEKISTSIRQLYDERVDKYKKYSTLTLDSTNDNYDILAQKIKKVILIKDEK
jgi:shikimate kinase